MLSDMISGFYDLDDVSVYFYNSHVDEEIVEKVFGDFLDNMSPGEDDNSR